MTYIGDADVYIGSFGTQYAVFYPSDGDPSYLEGGYTLEEAQDMASYEAEAYVVKITVERYDR